MSRIDELIEALCPEGVPFYRLDELFDVRGGFTPSKSEAKFWSNGSIPWFRMEDIRDGGRVLNSAAQMVSSAAAKSGGAFEADSIIISTSATIGEHAIVTVPFLANQRFSVLTRKREFRDAVDPKYAFYICFELSEYCKENTSVSSFAGVVMSAFKAFQFPVPPLQVQREIVSILDKFTQLEAELEAELEARRIQYEVTRDRLLDFDGDLSSHPLGEMIGEVCPTGVSMKIISEVIGKVGSIKWGEAGGQEYRYLDLSSVDLLTHEIGETTKISSANAPSRARQIVQKGDVIFATTRPAQMRFARIPETYDGQIASTGYCVLRPEPTDVLSGFLEHSLGSRAFRAYVVNNQVEGNYPSISDRAIKDFAFHVPPLEIQQEIVSILDKLDALVNDITIGLPAEIAARRKQYEYYRNKLLTFKELEAA